MEWTGKYMPVGDGSELMLERSRGGSWTSHVWKDETDG
jgi:hypothetical protein